MATTLISQAAFTGAMEAAVDGRPITSAVLTTYTTVNAAAVAFAAAFITANALLAVPMADADKAGMYSLIQGVVAGSLDGRSLVSATAADYATVALGIATCCKNAMSTLV